MANEEHLAILRQGVEAWNAWREENQDVRPDFQSAALSRANLSGAKLLGADLYKANLSGAMLPGADLCRADLSWAQLAYAALRRAALSGAKLAMANLSEADLSGADLGGANLSQAQLSGAQLPGANLRRADLSGADLRRANLQNSSLVDTHLTNANLTGCRIHGLSAWDLHLEGATQANLIITPYRQPEITVDNLEVAQFVYLLLHNEKIRNVIDTIGKKAALILGRFSEGRKPVLDALREALRGWDLLPILFDFSIPADRDVTETIKVLAGLARFVVADVTDATEVRVELHHIVRDFPSLPVQPILLHGREEFVSLRGNLAKFPGVLPTFEYEGQDHLLANLGERVIKPAEAKVATLVERRRAIEAELAKPS